LRVTLESLVSFPLVAGARCTQIVALTIAFKGNTVLGDNCAGYNFPNATIGKVPTKVVE
jgi:hypothetical protein